MVTFDTSISLGQIVTIIGFIVTMISAHYALKGRLIKIEASNELQNKLMEAMQREIKELNTIAAMCGRLDERVLSLQREVTELKHGKGFVEEDIRHP